MVDNTHKELYSIQVSPTMEDPKISLVIPAHNEENYIGTCMSHALNNANGKFSEVIVVDNASSDRTRQVAEQAAKNAQNVRVVHEHRKGPAHARQRGFEEAKGDIVAYIDADTRMPTGWSDTIVSEFKNDPNLVCLSGPYIYHDIPKWQQPILSAYWYAMAMPVYFAVGYMAIGGNLAIRRDTLQKMSGFDTSVPFYGDDTNLARRANQYGKVKFKPSFVMHTSARRLEGQGLLKTLALYNINYFSQVFMHRALTKKYRDIR